MLCNQQARDANTPDLQQGQRLCVPVVKAPYLPSWFELFQFQSVFLQYSCQWWISLCNWPANVWPWWTLRGQVLKCQTSATPLEAKALLARGVLGWTLIWEVYVCFASVHGEATRAPAIQKSNFGACRLRRALQWSHLSYCNNTHTHGLFASTDLGHCLGNSCWYLDRMSQIRVCVILWLTRMLSDDHKGQPWL